MVFLTGDTVAMVTGDANKITKTYSSIIWQLFDTIVVAVSNKNLLF